MRNVKAAPLSRTVDIKFVMARRKSWPILYDNRYLLWSGFPSTLWSSPWKVAVLLYVRRTRLLTPHMFWDASCDPWAYSRYLKKNSYEYDMTWYHTYFPPFFFFFLLIPSFSSALFSFPPSRKSDTGSHSRLFSPPPRYGSCLAFLSREDFIQPFLPSSTRVELRLPTLGALSSWSLFIFANKNHIIRTCLMYHAACKVEFQPFTRSYSQLTFFNFW